MYKIFKRQAPCIVIMIIVIVIMLLPDCAGAETFTVDDSGGANYTRIQDAINNASAGDTIEVYGGTYYENVNVSKQLTMRGFGMPVVNAGGNGSAITLAADGIRLEGFTATGGGYDYVDAGIRVISNSSTLNGNNASNNSYGISLSSSSNNTISGNNVSSNNWLSISLSSSSNNTISGNNASSNNYFGIFLYLSSNNTISCNNVSSNRWDGISLGSSDNNMLISNNVSKNWNGIFQDSSSNNTISGNNASSNTNYGIYLYYSSSNVIFNNIFNNTRNFYFTSSDNNTWNASMQSGHNIINGSHLGGNFWANPVGTGFSQTCADADLDGICDTGYTLTSENIDYLPLAPPAIIGTVLSGGTGISGIFVSTNTGISTTTNASGFYYLQVPAGTYNLTATKEPAYYTNSSVAVIVIPGTTTVQDIELMKKPTGTINGTVANA